MTMSAENEDRKPPPRETSPMLALTGTERPLPPGNHAAFAARAAVNPDERLRGARAPETAVSLGDFSLNGVMYYGAKMMVAPKTFVGKDQELTGFHFQRMRYTRPMRVPDKDAQPVFAADGKKRKATDRVRTECWSFVGGAPVQTADAGLRLKAYLVKEGFYTPENRAVLALLDTHCEGFFSYEKTREVAKTREAEKARETTRDDVMRGPIAGPAAKQPRLGSGPAENPYGGYAADRMFKQPLIHWRYALCMAGPNRKDGCIVGTEYVFALLGPASPMARLRVPLPDVRETFSRYLSLEDAMNRVMFALQREVSYERLVWADALLAEAGLTAEDQGRELAGFFSNAELGRLMAQGVFLGNHDLGWPAPPAGGTRPALSRARAGNLPGIRTRNLAHPPPETVTAVGGVSAFGAVLPDSSEEEGLALDLPVAATAEGLAPPLRVVAPPPPGEVPTAPQLGPAPRASLWDRLRWGGRSGAAA